MNDRQILAALQNREESALEELTRQHRRKGIRLAKHILGNDEDAEEIWNDALLQVWNAVPPAKPDNLGAYLHTVIRNLSIKRLEQRNAQKRGGGSQTVSLEQMPEYRQPAHGATVEQLMEQRMLDEAVNRFLTALPKETCTIFVYHYGSGRSIREIAEAFDISQSKVAVTLMRVRMKLRQYLKEEGWL